MTSPYQRGLVAQRMVSIPKHARNRKIWTLNANTHDFRRSRMIAEIKVRSSFVAMGLKIKGSEI